MSLFDDASLVTTPNGYKVSKLYSIKPTSGLGDMTVVRATTATRVNSAGLIESVAINVPRLDYPPLGGCPSILVEPARTNLLLRSEEFNNASWAKTGSTVTANTTTSPDGNLTADKLIEDTSTGSHSVARIGAISSAGTYTLSVYAKAAERTNIAIGNSSSNHFAIFNLSSGTIVQGSQGTVTNGAISSVDANGYYRISCNITVTAATSITINLVSTGTTTSYTGNGTSGLFIWGAQLELGSNPTSYIPTTTASVTRNADVISKTGISSLIGQTEGTMFAEVNLTTQTESGLFRRIMMISNGLESDSTYLRVTSGNIVQFVSFNGTAQCVINSLSSFNGTIKVAAAYKENDFVFYINGVLQGSDNSGTIPATRSILRIGNSDTLISAHNLNDRINLATLFPTRLTNAQLATLTTP